MPRSPVATAADPNAVTTVPAPLAWKPIAVAFQVVRVLAPSEVAPLAPEPF
ncbi:hypothetical protein D3C71_1897140 [compost metagenome]